MIVHRFMSEQEYRALVGGKVLRNSTNHRKKRQNRTTSIGFCFFTEDPDQAVHWLSGIADLDWCVTLEVPDTYLIPSWGMYLDEEGTDMSQPMNYDDFRRMAKFKQRKEYCRCMYSLREVKILAATDKYRHLYPPRSMHQDLLKAMMAGVKI